MCRITKLQIILLTNKTNYAEYNISMQCNGEIIFSLNIKQGYTSKSMKDHNHVPT